MDWHDDVPHFFVGFVRGFDFLGYPFGGVGVMVEGEGEAVAEEAAAEEAAAEEVAVVAVVVPHDCRVDRCSLVGRCRPRRCGCWVSVSSVCGGVGVAGFQFLDVEVC